MHLTGKQVLIVGASGKTGSILAERLAGTGAELYAAARYSDPSRHDELQELGVQKIDYDAKQDNPALLPEADLVILQVWAACEHTGPNSRNAIRRLNCRRAGRIVERYASEAIL